CLFFFQAEDGIRDPLVTGVQTCALPISHASSEASARRPASCTGIISNPCWRTGLRRPRYFAGSFWAGKHRPLLEPVDRSDQRREIGRASCRERVQTCVAALALQDKHETS